MHYLAEIASRSRAHAASNPHAVRTTPKSVDEILADDTINLAYVPDVVEEQFYRRVDPPAPHGWKRGTTAAWVGVVGSPSSLVVLTVLGFTAPRALVVALSLVFVASAIYLIAQLPEHGPSRQCPSARWTHLPRCFETCR